MLLKELLMLLRNNEEKFLKDIQTKNCMSCGTINGLVFKSPEAYKVSQILKTLTLHSV